MSTPLIDIDPEEDRLRDLDSEFGRPNPRRGWRHMRCIGDNLCADCDTRGDEARDRAKDEEATC
jgi:hypothetical protein